MHFGVCRARKRCQPRAARPKPVPSPRYAWRSPLQTKDTDVLESRRSPAAEVGCPPLLGTEPTGLLLQPSFTDVPEGYTTAQLDVEMASFAPEGAVGIYEVTSGTCEVIHELNGDQPLAIESVFELWVLAELANQIAEGTAAWDEPLEVRADLRSNPAGQVYQLADGDTLTLREYAEAMISISDNTATDHLIDRLGRESVETAMARAGVTEPELNQPFLATREFFWLKVPG